MSKINNWFQIHEVYIEETDNRPNRGPGCGIGMLDGCGSGKGVISNNPHKDHDNKFGLGLGDGCGFGNKRGEQD